MDTAAPPPPPPAPGPAAGPETTGAPAAAPVPVAGTAPPPDSAPVPPGPAARPAAVPLPRAPEPLPGTPRTPATPGTPPPAGPAAPAVAGACPPAAGGQAAGGHRARRPGERFLDTVGRDPMSVPRLRRNDAVLAAAVLFLAFAFALAGMDGRRPDALGWALLAGAVLPVAWRRSHPFPAVLAGLLFVVPYHALDNSHLAPLPGSLILLYTFATLSLLKHTALLGGAVVGLATGVMFGVGTHEGLETLRASGWVVSVLAVGAKVRVYRHYIASVVARAEHAERTREQEAARRVAEERIRIARDLHDLLAHSITLIGVRTAVASHVLTVDPDRLDRAAIAQALDDIADTCRAARGELRTTLTVLRTDHPDHPGPAGTPDGGGPLPDLRALPGLAAASGAYLTLRAGDGRLPSAVESAAYRIVQESLTNAVRHGGTGVAVAVTVERHGLALHVTVVDDGDGSPHPGPAALPGFGIAGMRERARSVHGTLTAGPRPGGGFRVAAVLPLPSPEIPQ
ncbi:sensor histidine kinase [Streptomyces sp. NPDC003691]